MMSYTCPECGGSISTEWNQHAEVYAHWCDLCGREFATDAMPQFRGIDQDKNTEVLQSFTDDSMRGLVAVGILRRCINCGRSFADYGWSRSEFCDRCNIGGQS